jgi:hypothetical protein
MRPLTKVDGVDKVDKVDKVDPVDHSKFPLAEIH